MRQRSREVPVQGVSNEVASDSKYRTICFPNYMGQLGPACVIRKRFILKANHDHAGAFCFGDGCDGIIGSAIFKEYLGLAILLYVGRKQLSELFSNATFYYFMFVVILEVRTHDVKNGESTVKALGQAGGVLRSPKPSRLQVGGEEYRPKWM